MKLKSVTKTKRQDTKWFGVDCATKRKFPYEYKVSIQYEGMIQISYHFSSDKYATLFAERVINTFIAYPDMRGMDAHDVISDLYAEVSAEQKVGRK